jgi:hypothetical protein
LPVQNYRRDLISSTQAQPNETSSQQEEANGMAGAVLKFLQDRALTQGPPNKSGKRRRIARGRAECLTEEAVNERIAQEEEEAHKKKLATQAKKEKANAKKLQAAETRVKAAHERFMKAKQASESTSSAISQTQKKALKTVNQSLTFCYICEEEMPKNPKQSWISCEDCGVWCCDVCRPSKSNIYYNDCARV